MVDERQLSTAQRHAKDLAFAQALLAGDPTALEILPARLACLPAMIRYQNRRLGGVLNATDIEDTVRDTIAALWSKLGHFEGRSTLETWVYRFAFLEVLKAVQEKCRLPQPLDREQSLQLRGVESDDPEPTVFNQQDLTEGLARLKRSAAEVIKQRHFEEQSFEDIAARNHTGVNTVKARYYRGLAQLKAVLERKVRREGA